MEDMRDCSPASCHVNFPSPSARSALIRSAGLKGALVTCAHTDFEDSSGASKTSTFLAAVTMSWGRFPLSECFGFHSRRSSHTQSADLHDVLASHLLATVPVLIHRCCFCCSHHFHCILLAHRLFESIAGFLDGEHKSCVEQQHQKLTAGTDSLIRPDRLPWATKPGPALLLDGVPETAASAFS